MALKKNTPPRVKAEQFDGDVIAALCAASRQDVTTAKPERSSPPLLSELVTPADHAGVDEEFWAHSDLSGELYQGAYRFARKRLDRELKVVRRDADLHDVILLTEAIKYWRKFHGEDRIQAGHLIASILVSLGFQSQNTVRRENTKKHSAILSAGRRLRAAGVEFVDDFKAVHTADSKAEHAEDKRIRRELPIRRKPAKAGRRN